MLRKLMLGIGVASLMGIGLAGPGHKDKNDAGKKAEKERKDRHKDANEDRRERNKDAKDDLKEHQKSERDDARDASKPMKHDLKKHQKQEKSDLKERQKTTRVRNHENGTPPGWSHGRKVGWNGQGVPPGQRRTSADRRRRDESERQKLRDHQWSETRAAQGASPQVKADLRRHQELERRDLELRLNPTGRIAKSERQKLQEHQRAETRAARSASQQVKDELQRQQLLARRHLEARLYPNGRSN